MTRVVLAFFFFVGVILTMDGAQAKTFYRWMDSDGVMQLSDQPPRNRDYQRVVMPDETPGEKPSSSVSEETKKEGEGAGAGEELTAEQKEIKKRQEDKVKELKELARHYEDVGGITAGKMAALKEAASVVKTSKMDGSEADEDFYAKIEELVRSIKNRTHVIGRVHRLLNEAKAMKGLAPPPKPEESEQEMTGGYEPAPAAQ
jgi:hypothetical protein